MYREVNSFAQAFPRRPNEHPLPEDAQQVRSPLLRTCKYVRGLAPFRPRSRGPSSQPVPHPKSPSTSRGGLPAVPTNTQSANLSSQDSPSGMATSDPIMTVSFPCLGRKIRMTKRSRLSSIPSERKKYRNWPINDQRRIS